MKLTGEELVSLCAEESNKPIWTIDQLTLDSLLNTRILEDIEKGIKYNGEAKKFEISYFSIDDMIIEKRTRIHLKFRTSIRKQPKDGRKLPEDFECMYTYLDVTDFYNAVIDLYYHYAESYNTDIGNIRLRLIEIEVMPPISFTTKGFINSKMLNQYDLDGQIDILRNLLKSQKWEIANNKIIFTQLISDKLMENLIRLFEKDYIINVEKRTGLLLDYSEINGLEQTRKNIKNKIEYEEAQKELLQKKVDDWQELYAMNLRRYKTKFDKGKNKVQTNIISVKYEEKFDTKTFNGKAYSYYTATDVNVGDLVIAPTTSGDKIARVSEINISEDRIAEIKPYLKLITDKIDKSRYLETGEALKILKTVNATDVVSILVTKLLEMGFIVHRYNSFTTSSIYLKLDFGVCCGIRIADHPGKKKYRYRFNVLKDYKGEKVICKNGLFCYFFNFNELESVVDSVKQEKQNKINRYGLENYQFYMEKEKKENELFMRFKKVS